MQIAQSTFPAPGWRQKRLEHEWRFAALRVRIAASRCLKHFHPNQPRVPTGNPDGGQWTDTGASHENATSGDMPVQLVQSRPPRSGGRISIGGQTFELTQTQRAEYFALFNQSAAAIRQVRTIDRDWNPTPSLTDSNPAGEMLRFRLERLEADAHLRRIIPLDFNGYNHYARFGRELHNATRRAGYDDVELYMRGSSVTGRNFRYGAPFNPESDYDVAIVSPTMMRTAQAIGVKLHRSRGRTQKLQKWQESRLGLREIADHLAREFGHPTNFMIYRSRQDVEIRDRQERAIMRQRHGNSFADDYISYRRIPIEGE